jgi:hypothetical protein
MRLLLTTLLSVPALAKTTQPYLNTWSVDSKMGIRLQ